MLVLPAWLRANDVTRVLEMYDDPLPTDIVVTKLDETYQVGGILHAALPNQLPYVIAKGSIQTMHEARATFRLKSSSYLSKNPICRVVV